MARAPTTHLRRLIGLLPRWERHLLMALELDGRPYEPPPALRLTWITDPADDGFDALVRLATEQGLDRAWCEEQLADGATALVACVDETPAGMGLLTTRPFFVQEIACTFDPGPAGGYLYATYVTPRFRGQRIQRALDRARAARLQSLARRTAYALVESDNTPSIRGHRAGGFHPAARIDRLIVGRWTRTFHRALSAAGRRCALAS